MFESIQGAYEARVSLPRESIEGWLRDKVAEVLGTTADGVDRDRTFVELGLDSVMLVCVAGELEVLLLRELGDDLLQRHRTIAALAHHLAETAPSKVEVVCELPMLEAAIAREVAIRDAQRAYQLELPHCDSELPREFPKRDTEVSGVRRLPTSELDDGDDANGASDLETGRVRSA
jgi:acyl carrier protein